MQINGSVAFVTGANRGIGKAFARELVRQGASTVYAAARDPESVDIKGVTPVRLDVTDHEQVVAAAAQASDTTLLINNAGISTFSRLIDGPMDEIRREMDTNYFGTLDVVRHFAPHLGANGGGAIMNVLSVMAWLGFEHSNSYGASKAALWALSNGIRVELSAQNTQVTSLLLGSTDTDMMAAFDVEKNQPADVVRTALAGLAKGDLEVFADAFSSSLKRSIGQDLAELYPQVARGN